MWGQFINQLNYYFSDARFQCSCSCGGKNDGNNGIEMARHFNPIIFRLSSLDLIYANLHIIHFVPNFRFSAMWVNVLKIHPPFCHNTPLHFVSPWKIAIIKSYSMQNRPHFIFHEDEFIMGNERIGCPWWYFVHIGNIVGIGFSNSIALRALSLPLLLFYLQCS